MLRHTIALLFFLSLNASAASEPGVMGQVHSVPGCSPKVMVWLSLDHEDYQQRLLLMHTLVPVGGKYQFYLKPGQYQLRATDDKGCDFLQKVNVGRSLSSVPVRMKK